MRGAIIGAAAALAGAFIGAGAAIGAAALTGTYSVAAARYAPLETRWLDARGVARVLERRLHDQALNLAAYYRVPVPRGSTALTPSWKVRYCFSTPRSCPRVLRRLAARALGQNSRPFWRIRRRSDFSRHYSTATRFESSIVLCATWTAHGPASVVFEPKRRNG
jgi:hypothetical protein